jgi:UDP-N-acetyl-D-mannosaminuronic acid dehydrogenase
LKLRYDLKKMTVGILGMAFKANSDDRRESLSYKLRKVLAFESATVLCSDSHISDPEFVSVQEIIDRCDIVVVGAPHREYHDLKIPASKVSVDIWNLWGNGCLL